MKTTVKLVITVSLLFITLLGSGCGPSEKEFQTFARFQAKKRLLEEYGKFQPDSLPNYIAGLYKEEKMTPEKLHKLQTYCDKHPEEWIGVQKRILLALDTLNPARPKETKTVK